MRFPSRLARNSLASCRYKNAFVDSDRVCGPRAAEDSCLPLGRIAVLVGPLAWCFLPV